MKFKTLLSAALAATVISGSVAAQEMKFFRIGTGGAGGTYFPIGGIIANAISNPPGSRPCDEGGNCGVPGTKNSKKKSPPPPADTATLGTGRLLGRMAYTGGDSPGQALAVSNIEDRSSSPGSRLVSRPAPRVAE